MSEFWRGFLALPVLIIGLALAVGLVFGAWVLVDKWLQYRWFTTKPIRDPEPHKSAHSGTWWTAPSFNNRSNWAAHLLAGRRVAGFRLTWGVYLAFIVTNRDPKAVRRTKQAIETAYNDVVKAEREQETP